MNNNKLVVISVIVTAVIVFLLSYIIFGMKKEMPEFSSQIENQLNYSDKAKTKDDNFNNTTKNETDISSVNNVKKFVDNSSGYSFSYSSDIVTEPLSSPSVVTLSAYGAPINMLHEAFNGPALKNKEILDKGKIGQAAFALPESVKLIKLNNSKFGQKYIVFRALEVCDVQFNGVIEFYNNDKQIKINIIGPVKKFQSLLPDYFTVDKTNCGSGYLVWQSKKIPELYQKLDNGAAPIEVQKWFDEFNKIADSIEIK